MRRACADALSWNARGRRGGFPPRGALHSRPELGGVTPTRRVRKGGGGGAGGPGPRRSGPPTNARDARAHLGPSLRAQGGSHTWRTDGGGGPGVEGVGRGLLPGFWRIPPGTDQGPDKGPDPRTGRVNREGQIPPKPVSPTESFVRVPHD